MTTTAHRRRLRRLLVVLLILCALWQLLPFRQHITLQPPATAPVNTRPDLPWQLTLVNRWNGLPAGYSLTLARTRDGQTIDRRIRADLEAMLDDAAAAGYDVSLNSGYRSSDEQQTLFAEKTAALCANGYDTATAEQLAAQWVSPPGTSEHELGLAVDIGTSTTALYDWLLANSWRYGFIQRYPDNKTNITGVAHEPWHFRYVGTEAAAEIHAQNLCLEEYLARQGP